MTAPIPFDQAIADEICDRLCKGESLRAICGVERDDFMPGQTTVFRWLAENDIFAKQYAYAREAQAEAFVDEMVAIADSPNATVDPDTKEPVIRDPARDRLRVDTRKWVASKMLPKKYGDKIDVTHAGGITITHEQALADLK